MERRFCYVDGRHAAEGVAGRLPCWSVRFLALCPAGSSSSGISRCRGWAVVSCVDDAARESRRVAAVAVARGRVRGPPDHPRATIETRELERRDIQGQRTYPGRLGGHSPRPGDKPRNSALTRIAGLRRTTIARGSAEGDDRSSLSRSGNQVLLRNSLASARCRVAGGPGRLLAGA